MSEIGTQIANLPLAPRLGRLMIAGFEAGIGREAAVLAACLSEDEVTHLDVLDCQEHNLSDATRKLIKLLQANIPTSVQGKKATSDVRQTLAQCMLRAYADRVARKRNTTGQRATPEPKVDLVMCGGGTAEVALCPTTDAAEFFAVLDVQERQPVGTSKARLHVKTLCPLNADWLLDLPNGLLAETDVVEWDEKLGRAYQINRLSYGNLVLSESRVLCDDPKLRARVLLKSALGLDDDRLSRIGPLEFLEAFRKIGDPTPLESVFARVQLLRKFHPEITLPDLDDGGVAACVSEIFAQVNQLKELTDESVADQMLTGLVPPGIIGRLPTWLPNTIALPNGRRVRVHYAWGQDPWVESRLQDFFGLRATPTILGGRLSLTMHLLAPNKRALQVTRDLASFWQKAYQELRPQLSRRYPRHAWPEDPTTL